MRHFKIFNIHIALDILLFNIQATYMLSNASVYVDMYIGTIRMYCNALDTLTHYA